MSTAHRALPRYLAAALGARLADEGARLSLVLIAVGSTGSPGAGGLAVAALLIPHVVAAPVLGALVDRSRRPGLLLAAAIGGFAGALALSAVAFGRWPLPLVLVVLVLGGSCGPAITGGLTSRLPELVGPDRLPRAFGLDSLGYNVASVSGPLLVGALAVLAGPTAAQLTLAGCAAVGAVLVATLPVRRVGEVTARPRLGDGVRGILGQPVLARVTVVSSLGQVGLGGLGVVAVGLAAAQASPASSGVLLAAVAVGALVGSAAWTWRPWPVGRAPRVVAASLVGSGAPLALAALAVPIGGLGIEIALFAVSGFFVGPFASALFLTREHYATPRIRTQVFAIGAGLKVTAAAIGAAGAGLVAGWPVPVQLVVVGAIPVLAGVAGLAASRVRPAPDRPGGGTLQARPPPHPPHAPPIFHSE